MVHYDFASLFFAMFSIPPWIDAACLIKK
jgi:hypothetical protein